MSELLKSRTVQVILAFSIGFIISYFLLPTKIITKEVKVVEYVKVKGKTVTVTKPDGSSTATTDFVSDSTTHTASSERIEINPRYSTIEIGMMVDKRAYVHAQTTLIRPVVAGIHIDIVPSNRKTSVGFGLGIRF